jgi:superfamily I DNA/RNA helicase
MTGRVKRITAAALGTGDIDLPWAGTFHAVGARLLREYAHRIGLQPSFTILDRSDAADLMNLVRHGLDLSKKESRFPKKASIPYLVISRRIHLCKYPPAEPGALGLGPLEAAGGVADAAPLLGPPKGGDQRHRLS